MCNTSKMTKWDNISNWMIQWVACLHSTVIKWNNISHWMIPWDNISNWMIKLDNISYWMIQWDNISHWMIRWDSISYWMIRRDSISYWMMKWSRDTAESVLSRGTKRRREIEDDLRKERQLFSVIVELCTKLSSIYCLNGIFALYL